MSPDRKPFDSSRAAMWYLYHASMRKRWRLDEETGRWGWHHEPKAHRWSEALTSTENLLLVLHIARSDLFRLDMDNRPELYWAIMHPRWSRIFANLEGGRDEADPRKLRFAGRYPHSEIRIWDHPEFSWSDVLVGTGERPRGPLGKMVAIKILMTE